jgi:hypothetical protein
VNEFPQLEELSDILEELISKSEQVLKTINKFSLRKRLLKKDVSAFSESFEDIIELQDKVEAICNFASIQKQRPFTPSEESGKGLSVKILKLIKRGVVSIPSLKGTDVHRYCEETLQRANVEASVRGIDKIGDIYNSLPANTPDAAYMEILKSVASYYHEHKESHTEFNEYQIGVSVDDQEILDISRKIREIGGREFNRKLQKKENLSKFIDLPEFKLRKSFSETIKTIKELFHSVHPEIGEMAETILHPDNLKKTKDQSTLYMLHSFGCMPQMIVNPSTRFNDELGIVHELTHGVHFALKDQGNSILNIEQTTTTVETISLFFELLFIHRQFLKAKSKASAENLREYMTRYMIAMFYERSMFCEFETQFFLNIGSTIQNEKDSSKLYVDTWKKYWGQRFNPPKSLKSDWKAYQSILTPHLNFVYLLSVIYAVELFLKYITFEIKGEDILLMLRKGSEFSANNIIPWEKILSHDETLFERIMKVILEFNRAK